MWTLRDWKHRVHQPVWTIWEQFRAVNPKLFSLLPHWLPGFIFCRVRLIMRSVLQWAKRALHKLLFWKNNRISWVLLVTCVTGVCPVKTSKTLWEPIYIKDWILTRLWLFLWIWIEVNKHVIRFAGENLQRNHCLFCRMWHLYLSQCNAGAQSKFGLAWHMWGRCIRGRVSSGSQRGAAVDTDFYHWWAAIRPKRC